MPRRNRRAPGHPPDTVRVADAASSPAHRRPLTEQLRLAQRELHDTVQTLSATNEELRCSNEELLAMNEELQAANDEQVRAQGALRQAGEAQQVLNDELERHVQALQRAHADVEHLLDSTEGATVFLDRELRIRRYARAAAQVFSLTPADLGRPLADLASPLVDFDVGAAARTAIDELAAAEHEVRSTRGAWYLLRVRPYTTPDGAVAGAVVTALDMTDRHAIEERLRDSEAHVRSLNQALEARVSERTSELRQTLAELEAFSYSISHDLRAPLRAIDGFSQALTEEFDTGLGEKGRHYLRRIRSGAQRMGQLIDDLLALSRVTQAELHSEPFSLSAVATDVVRELRAADPDRVLDVAIAPDLVAEGDRALLRVALANLLGNAWKFTRDVDDAHVEFGTLAAPDAHVYFVRDNGAGFDMTYVDKLFKPFQRLHGEEFEGTGIGLATVRRVITRHGGRIWAEGVPHGGATVYFTLPVLH